MRLATLKRTLINSQEEETPSDEGSGDARCTSELSATTTSGGPDRKNRKLVASAVLWQELAAARPAQPAVSAGRERFAPQSSWNRERAGPHNARRGSGRFCGAGHAAKLNNAISDSSIGRRSRQLGRRLGAQHGAGDFPSHDTPSQKFLKKNSATRFRSRVVRLRDSSSQILQQKGDARSIQKLSCACAEIALLTSRNRRNGELDFRHGESNGGNHDDCRISGCDCSDRLDCVGRAGAVDAGKLSDAN